MLFAYPSKFVSGYTTSPHPFSFSFISIPIYLTVSPLPFPCSLHIPSLSTSHLTHSPLPSIPPLKVSNFYLPRPNPSSFFLFIHPFMMTSSYPFTSALISALSNFYLPSPFPSSFLLFTHPFWFSYFYALVALSRASRSSFPSLLILLLALSVHLS